MRMFLDTHAFLWFVLGDPTLSTTARQAIIEVLTMRLPISPASYWEIAIKIRLKKYTLPQPYETFMQREIVRRTGSVFSHCPQAYGGLDQFAVPPS